MRKKIMLLGKSLITFSLLWPIPVGLIIYFLIYDSLCALSRWMVKIGVVSADVRSFILNTILNPLGEIPLWGISHEYWRPLLYIVIAGITLCLLSRYASKGYDNSRQTIEDAPLRLLWPLVLIGLGIIALFWAVILIVVVLYHLFLTHLIVYSVPALFGLIILGLLIWFGVEYDKNYKK